MPFFFLCIFIVCTALQEPAHVVATVDQHPITTAHVNDLLEQRFPVWKNTPADAPAIIRKAVATSLVERQLAMARLKDLGKEGLEAKIERQIEQETERLQRISQTASLTDVQLDKIAWKTAWSDYLETHLTEENLKSFFETHRIKFDGTQRDVSQIFMKESPDAEVKLKQISNDIAAGKFTIELAANQHSQSTSAEDGGALGWVSYVGDLPTAVSKAVFEAELGIPIGPIQSAMGWHLIVVREQRDGTLDYDTLVDHQTLRREAADFLFERLVEAGKSNHQVEWATNTP